MICVLTIALLLITIFLVFLWKYLQKCLFWKRQEVEIINAWHLFQKTRKVHLYQIIDEIYRELCAEEKPCKVIETFFNSTVILQDQTAIKEVLTSQFENFPDRGFYINRRDPLLVNLARFHYELWKPLRRKLTPAFSPAKLKYVFPTMAKVGEHMVDVLGEQIVANEKAVVEMHDLCKRFAMDVIGTIAFGIECNSLKNPKAELKTQGEKALAQHFRPFTDQFAEKYSRIMNFFDFKYHSKETRKFFTKVVKETLEYRQKFQIKRHNFLDLLLECRDNEKEDSDSESHLSLEMMVGQVFIFFIGGYESTSSALSQALFELARNPGVQEKARHEIKQILEENENKISYESIKSLRYTKQVIMETLRKYPIVPGLMRFCRHDCTLNTTSGLLTIPEDTTVMIPVYSIHNNPEIYPKPDLFLPERFDDEVIAERPPYTFLTFGEGPRNCLASGFGMMELLFGLTTLLSHFRFSICEKSPKEVEFDLNTKYLASIKSGIFLNVEKL